MVFKNKKFLLERINKCPFNLHNQIHAMEVNEGYSVVVATLTEDSVNIWGLPHGGLLFSLGDVAAGLAGQSFGDKQVVTTSSNMNFLQKPHVSKCGRLTATARVLRSTRSLGFFRVDIQDEENNLIATGEFVMYYANGANISKEV